MKVMLVGGPFDGWIIEAQERHGLPERSTFSFRLQSSSKGKLTAEDFATLSNSPCSPNTPVPDILYVLDKTYITDKPHNFEYHYQGR